MNLLHLRYFYEVALLGNVTLAATRLRISQPAISKMVKQLESNLGHKLFDRTRSGFVLTSDGAILYESASKIFSEVRRAEEQLQSSGRDFVGDWGLAASENLAIHMIPKPLGLFREKHPRLKINLFSGTSGQIKEELYFDRSQLGLFFTPLKAGEPFKSQEIFRTEFWIVISGKNRWFKRGAEVKLEDLKKREIPRIESRHSDYSGGFPAHFHSKRLGLTSDPWIEVNQHEVKKKLVLEGFGFALLTRHTVEEEVESGKLTRVKANVTLPAPVYAVWKSGKNPGRISLAFLDLLNAKRNP